MTESIETAQTSATSAMVAVIEKAAMSKDVDVDKIGRLLAMQERIMAKQAEVEFNQAMARAQAAMPKIHMQSEISHGQGRKIASYAKYEEIDDAIRLIYSAEGFSRSFDTQPQQDGRVLYSCTVSHVGGHSVTRTMALPADTGGAKNAVQALGSSTTYAKRYLVGMHFNLVFTDDPADDDGQSAGLVLINDDQLRTLEEFLSATDSNVAAFCKNFGVPSVDALPASKYDTAMQMLRAKKERLGTK